MVDFEKKMNLLNDIDLANRNFMLRTWDIILFSFSYPFGEYSDFIKKVISLKILNFSFGQHSGVIDLNKDTATNFQDFRLMKNMGILKRFKFLINLTSLRV